MAEVEVAETPERLLGRVQVLDTILLQADLTFLPGVVPRFGRPTPTLSSSKAVGTVRLSKVTAAHMALRRQLTAVFSSGERREVIHKHLVTLNNHRTTTTRNFTKANMLSNSKPHLPINTNIHSNTR